MGGAIASTPQPLTALFERLARCVITHRLVVAIVILGLTGWAGALAVLKLTINNSLEVFTPKGAVEAETLESFREAFGREDAILLVVEGDVFSEPFLRQLETLHSVAAAIDADVDATSHVEQAAIEADDLEGFDEFDDDPEGWGDEAGGTVIENVSSLINARRTRSRPGGISVEKLLEPFPEDLDVDALRDEVLSDPLLVGSFVGAEGRHAVVLVQPMRMRDEDIEKVFFAVQDATRHLDREGFRILYTGTPAVAATMNKMVLDDMSILALLSTIVVVFTLLWLFRHPIGVLGPVVVVMMSTVWTLGFMGAAGFQLNMLSSILPAFLYCVGAGDSIHILSIYRDLRRHGIDNEAAIVQAAGTTGPPVLFTSLTTMLGLFSLSFASVGAIADMGIVGGLGVMVALLLSVTVLPWFLTFNTTSLMGAKPPKARDFVDGIVDGLAAVSDDRIRSGRRARTFGLAFLLLGLAALGIASLEVSHDDLETIPDEEPVERAVRAMDAHVSGAAAANLVVSPASERGMKDVALLKALDALIADLPADEEPGTGERIVTHSLSMLDVVKETSRALHAGDTAHYAVPHSQGETDDVLFLFESQGPDELRRLATLDLSRSHVSFRVKWREATSLKPLLDHIERAIDRHIGDLAEVRGTGHAFLAYRIVVTLLTDLMKSFGTAFALISLLMIGMLRDVRLGLIAMLPNLFPIALVMGFMGLTGIPLDLNNLLIASIALGIAVDDTIHFLHHFQVAYRESGDCEYALAQARHHAGRAMVATSLLLAVGFGVYMAAHNLAVVRFGLLTALTVITALLVDLTLLPAMLRKAYPAVAGSPSREYGRAREGRDRL